MPTLKEVAQKADVSIATVSRVINNSNKVNPETRERVQKAMRTLGYRPSRVAQRLRNTNGKSKLLGLIIPDIQNPFYSRIVRGIEDVAYQNDYALILCNSDENPARERFYLDVLRSESVDGVILPPIHQYGNVLDRIIDSGIPVVCVDRKLAKDSVDTVVVNNRKGAYEAISHLLDLNHRRIAILASSSKYSSFKERLEGYEQALREKGVEIDESLIREGDPRNAEKAKELTLELLQLEPSPTALFVTNNLMSLGVLQAINELNLSIPKDISVVMFDDISWATVVSPPLTVVKQPSYEIGRRAAELLFQRISDPDRETVEVIMDTTLIVRSSTSRPLESVLS